MLFDIPENPEFGDGYKSWNKKKVFGFGSRHQVFWGVKFCPKTVFWALFTICFRPDTNIEIIVVNCPNTDNIQKLTNAIFF